MVTRKKPAPPSKVADETSAARMCTVVDGCTGVAVLQAERTCTSCGAESANLRANADTRRAELAQVDAREADVKAAARARDGQCGCGDPSSHDGSPSPVAKRAKKAADLVTHPRPCPRPQKGELTELERFDLALAAGRRRELGTQIEQLDAAAARVAKKHTHPVFACDKHKGRLPR